MTVIASFDSRASQIIVLALIAWLALAGMVAAYGTQRGYPFLPLFLCTILFGPFGPPVVLLAVVLGAGPRTSQ